MDKMHLINHGRWVLDKQMDIIIRSARIELEQMGIIPKKTKFEIMCEESAMILRDLKKFDLQKLWWKK